MTARKPIEPGCTFGIDCELPGHVTARRRGNGTVWSHFRPTVGQRKTRREALMREREWTKRITGRVPRES